MKDLRASCLAICAVLATGSTPTLAQDDVITYQGRVQTGGTGFTGTGQFKFALVTVIDTAATATATAQLTGQFVTGYTVTSGGNGYVLPPLVTVTGGGGSGATATAVVSAGQVTAINPTSAGNGYSSPPLVTIEAPPVTLEYTTYWSNDGSSVDGSEPAAAVSVAADGGFFTVRLGDTSLPGMQALPAGLFHQPDLRLRIWFNDGVNGFEVLEPSQPLTAVPYAMKASAATTVPAGTITSAMLADGAVTSSKLAAGSVGGAQLQNGSIQGSHIQASTITAANLAPGAIGPGASNQRYLSGRVSVEVYNPISYFGEYQINQNISFSTPFANPPVVTVAVETPLSSASRLLFPVLVRNKATTGFQLSFPLRTLPIGVELRGSIARAPVTVVNGRPAVAFSNPGLRFARAQDTFGKRWQPSIAVDGSSQLRQIELLVVNGNPAIAFTYSTGNIYYIRANDADGTSWPASAVGLGSAGSSPDISMAIIGGNPAIALRNSTTKQIIYIRATDANGSAWGTAYQAAVGKPGIHLAEISGLPAISYSWDNGANPGNPNTPTYQLDLRYRRAGNVAGSSWGSEVPIATYGQNYTMNQTALIVVNGNPSIFYHLGEPQIPFQAPIRPWFVRAGDANGATWGSPVNVYPVGTMTGDFSAAVINGQPAMVWHLIERDLIQYSFSGNNGVSFSTSIAFQRGDYSSSFVLSLAQVQGQPALTYSDGEELFYLRDLTSSPDTYINWIAVEP